MNMNNKIFWLSVLSCAFSGSAALANSIKNQGTAVPVMISHEQLTNSGWFQDAKFVKVVDGFRLEGSYPKACADNLSVRLIGDSTNNRFGLQASSESVIECLKANGNSTDRAFLSQLGVFQAKDGDVQFYWEDNSKDLSSRFDSVTIQADYKTDTTLAIEANLTAQGLQGDRVTEILAEIETGCSGDEEEVSRAKEGLEELSAMSLINARDLKKLSLALDNVSGLNSLQEFHDRVAEADYSDLKEIRRDLKKFIRSKELRKNPDAQDEGAVIMAEVIARYREQKQEEPKKVLQVCSSMRDTVREAQSFSRLSSESRSDLKNIQNETEIDCMSDLAKYGRKNNMLFDANHQALMSRLSQEKDYACNAGINPAYETSYDLSYCAKAIESYQYAEALPKYADDADKRRQDQVDALNKQRAASTSTSGAGQIGVNSYASLTGFYGQNSSVFH